MNSDEEEKKLAEDLSKFLQNFKLIIGTKIRLMECLLENKSAQSLFTKILLRENIHHEDYLTNNAIVKGVKEKIFYRFCLRINQFIEYRLCDMKHHKELYVRNQVLSFQKTLNTIFSQVIHSPPVNMVLKQLLIAQTNFSDKLLNKITNNARKNNMDIQLIEDINEIISKKFPHYQPQNKNQRNFEIKSANIFVSPYKKDLKNQKYKRNSTDLNTFELPEIDHSSFIIKSLSTGLQQPVKQFNISKNDLFSSLKDINSQEDTSINKFTKKQLYQRALTNVMELQQSPFTLYSNDYMMQQLRELNKKNQQIINKFRKRNTRRSQSQKQLTKSQSKSTRKKLFKNKQLIDNNQKLPILQRKHTLLK